MKPASQMPIVCATRPTGVGHTTACRAKRARAGWLAARGVPDQDRSDRRLLRMRDPADGCRLLPSFDREATPLLWFDILQSLGQRPAVAGRVEERALALTVGKVAWLTDDLTPTSADAFAQGGDVFDSKHHRLRRLLVERRRPAMADVGHDQRALAEGQLRAVSRADPDPLHEPQHLNQPIKLVRRSGRRR